MLYLFRFLRIVDVVCCLTHFLVDVCANQYCPPTYPIKLSCELGTQTACSDKAGQ